MFYASLYMCLGFNHVCLSFYYFDTIGHYVILNEFLKWYEDRQKPSSTTFIAHIGTSFIGLNQSTSLGSWVFVSYATNHITGNKSLFSSLSSTCYSPSVTMVDG